MVHLGETERFLLNRKVESESYKYDLIMPPHQLQLWTEALCFPSILLHVRMYMRPILVGDISQKQLEGILITFDTNVHLDSKMN